MRSDNPACRRPPQGCPASNRRPAAGRPPAAIVGHGSDAPRCCRPRWPAVRWAPIAGARSWTRRRATGRARGGRSPNCRMPAATTPGGGCSVTARSISWSRAPAAPTRTSRRPRPGIDRHAPWPALPVPACGRRWARAQVSRARWPTVRASRQVSIRPAARRKPRAV